MHDARPALVLLTLALTGLGYGAPWVFSALYEEPVVPTVRSLGGDGERVVRITIRPEAPPAPERRLVPEPEPMPVASAPTGTGLPLATKRESVPRVQSGPAPEGVRRVSVGVAREVRSVPARDAVAKSGRQGRKGKRRRRACEPDLAEIAQVAEQGYRVEDSLVAFYAGHPRETEKLARTWWNKDDTGERDGFRVGRLRCGTVLHQLGLRSGDAVMAINGKRIQSYADGLTAYLRVRQKELIWIDVVRKGEPLRLDYLLVEDGYAEAVLASEVLDPTFLVDQQLALEELPWRERRKGRRVQKRRMSDAALSSPERRLPGVRDVGELPGD